MTTLSLNGVAFPHVHVEPNPPGIGDVSSRYELHPDTAPDAIADVQRQDVADCWNVMGLRGPDEISVVVVLPVWVVKRRLQELRKADGPVSRLLPKGTVPPLVVAALQGVDRLTAPQIAFKTNLPLAAVQTALRLGETKGVFVRHLIEGAKFRKSRFQWGLAT